MKIYTVIFLFSIYLVGCVSPASFKYQHPRPVPEITSSDNLKCDFDIENKVSPKYPHGAMMKYQEGWAIIRGTVFQGRIKEVAVIDSSPKGVFEEASMNAIESWKFILAAESKTKEICSSIEFKQLFLFNMHNQEEVRINYDKQGYQ